MRRCVATHIYVCTLCICALYGGSVSLIMQSSRRLSSVSHARLACVVCARESIKRREFNGFIPEKNHCVTAWRFHDTCYIIVSAAYISDWSTGALQGPLGVRCVSIPYLYTPYTYTNKTKHQWDYISFPCCYYGDGKISVESIITSDNVLLWYTL